MCNREFIETALLNLKKIYSVKIVLRRLLLNQQKIHEKKIDNQKQFLMDLKFEIFL